MVMCDDNHEEIVYDRGKCPLCQALKDIERLEEEVSDLKDKLDE